MAVCLELIRIIKSSLKELYYRWKTFESVETWSRGRANRLAGKDNKTKRETFRKRLSGVVFKPPYAAVTRKRYGGER